MNLRVLFITILIMLAVKAVAGAGHCSHARLGAGPAARTTTADPGEDFYDIKHLGFNLYLSDTSVYVKGDVSTTAMVVAPAMSSYIFELDTAMVIDSAKLNGALYPVTNTGGIRAIALTTALSAGSMFTAHVYYHGQPTGSGASFFNGITHAVTPGGTHTVFTISDPYVAKNWWPCKQSPSRLSQFGH